MKMLKYIHESLNHNVNRSHAEICSANKIRKGKKNCGIIANNAFISTLNISQTLGTVP
jgi:hypothetical protein